MSDTIFDLDKVDENIRNSELVYDEMEDCFMQSYYLGSCLNIMPSGKYYLPFACSNVTEEEAEKDHEYYVLMEAELDEINAHITSGEGDPTDMFITRQYDIDGVIALLELNIRKCSNDIYLIDSREDIKELTKLGYDIDNINCGFSDEYVVCEKCNKAIYVYSSMPDCATINESELLCGDCIREDKTKQEQLIEDVINNPKRAIAILTEKILEEHGFKKCSCDSEGNICKFETGLHTHMTDDPTKILENAISRNPYKEYIFEVTDANMFGVEYTIWNRDKNME